MLVVAVVKMLLPMVVDGLRLATAAVLIASVASNTAAAVEAVCNSSM